MAKKPLTRKQLLKEPDQFITFTGRLIEFGKSNLKPILIGVGALIVMLVVIVAVNQISQRNERLASEMVEKVMATYSAALADTDAKTAYDRVKPEFESLFDQYGGKKAAILARIVYADICYRAEDADAAIAMYTHALDDFGQTGAMKNIVLSGLAHAHQLKGDRSAAIQYYSMIAEGEDPTLKSDAMFNLSCLYEADGKIEKRNAILDRMIADFPGSPYEELAKEKTRS